MTYWIEEEAEFVLTYRRREPLKILFRMATTAFALASTASVGGWLLYSPFNGTHATPPIASLSLPSLSARLQASLEKAPAPLPQANAQASSSSQKAPVSKAQLVERYAELLSPQFVLGAAPRKLALQAMPPAALQAPNAHTPQQVALAQVPLPPEAVPVVVQKSVAVPIPEPRPGGLAPTTGWQVASLPSAEEEARVASDEAPTAMPQVARIATPAAEPVAPLPPSRPATLGPDALKPTHDFTAEPVPVPLPPPSLPMAQRRPEPAATAPRPAPVPAPVPAAASPRMAEKPHVIQHEIAKIAPAPVMHASTTPGALTNSPEQDASARPMIASLPSIHAAPMTARQQRAQARLARRLAKQNHSTTLAATTPDKRSFFQKFFGGNSQDGSALAYASTDAGQPSFGNNIPASLAPSNGTAVYNISTHTVYLPNGQRLEAHSGLGANLDNPRSVSVRMRGATPPHVYELTPRERLFHGVAALRLNPVGGGHLYGRNGLLAHTYMLGPRGDSNGCISFRNYNAFLQAYRSGEVKRLVVVTGQG